MEIQLKIIILITIISLHSFADIIYTNYINREDFPIKITVPYYAPESKDQELLEIELQSGDMYEARAGKNGIIYPKYALLPDALWSLLPKGDSDRDDGNRLGTLQKLRNVERFTNIEKIPKDIVRSQKRAFEYKLNELTDKISQFKTLDSQDQKILNKMLILTNNYENVVEALSDPILDPDEDGFNNAKEAEYNTNPLIYNDLAIGPHYFKVDPQNNAVAKGYFSIINNSTTNRKVHLKLSDYSDGTKDLFKPRLQLVKNGYKTKKYGEILSFDISPKSEETVAFLAKTEYLPSYFQIHIDCYSAKNKLKEIEGVAEKDLRDENLYEKIGRVSPVLVNYECPLPGKPIITSPKNGSRFCLLKGINFKWKDDGKINKCDGNLSSHNVQIYKYNDESKQLNSCNFLELKGEFKAKIDEHNDFYTYNAPGIFFWRALKVTESNCASFSDWQWFVIGKEVGPKDDAKLKLKNQIVYHKIQIPSSKFDAFDWEYEFDDNYINLHAKTYYDKPPFNMFFIEPLPKGIIKKKPYNDKFYPFYIGVENRNMPTGTYTNRFVISDGKITLTNEHIFIIRRNF